MGRLVKVLFVDAREWSVLEVEEGNVLNVTRHQ